MTIPRSHTGHRVGQHHHRAKLSDDRVRQMRSIYADWKGRGARKGYASLAKMFGCGISTARDICTYRTRWAA